MVRVLILGAGNMARTHALAYQAMPEVELAGVVDPMPDALAAFQAEFSIERGFADIDAALGWGAFDAASNVTPDAFHHATTMALLAAGKHVLCEKPLATTAADAEEMTRAAEAAGLVNHVNLSYRASPASAKARELVGAGALGDLRHFDASYLQSWLVGHQWGDWRTEPRWLWRLSTAHGSHGVVGDVGVHIIDLLIFVAREDIARFHANTFTFDKAEGGRIGDYTLDANDSFTLNAQLAGGALGVLHATRWATGHANDLRIELFGAKGGLRLDTTGKDSSLSLCSGEDIHTVTWHDVECPPTPSNYELFITAIGGGPDTGASFAEAARVQAILDAVLASGEMAG